MLRLVKLCRPFTSPLSGGIRTEPSPVLKIARQPRTSPLGLLTLPMFVQSCDPMKSWPFDGHVHAIVEAVGDDGAAGYRS